MNVMATINIVGDLVLDQSAGVTDDDVAISVDGNGDIIGGIDPAFLAYLNGLGLSSAQLAYADTAEAASQVGLVEVTPSANETVVELEFAPLTDAPSGLFTLDGEAIFLTTVQNGSAVEARDASGDLVAAFYIIPNADNTSGTVQMITFEAIDHPLNPDPDDRVDFSDILKVRALSETTTPIGEDINVDDDGPSISQATDAVNLVVDETDLTTANDSDDFSTQFTKDGGTDGEASTVHTLSITGGSGTNSGLVHTASGEAVLLFNNNGVIEGRTVDANGALVFTVTTTAAGVVTLNQVEAVVHPDPNADDESVSLSLDNLIVLTATITDNDGDTDSADLNIGQNLVFHDDIPSISQATDAVNLVVDETDLTTADDSDDFSTQFTKDGGADGEASTVHTLSITGGDGTNSGLVHTTSGLAVLLFNNNGVIEGRTVAPNGTLVFTVTTTAAGVVTLNQVEAVVHPDPNVDDESVSLSLDNLIVLTATITDNDGDTDSADLNIGQNLVFHDDIPTIVDQDAVEPGIQGFDGDPGTAGAQDETLTNAVGVTATGKFVFDIGADGRLVYDATHSDFGDADSVTAGVQRLVLTGTVDNAQNPNITNIVTSLTSESATSAAFAFSFHYDKDPITAGVQDATAGGTLTFDKVAGTYSIALNDVIDGFSFNVFHSSELLTKAPPGNTGHPELVVTELDVFDANGADDISGNADDDTDGFYVQFTANSNPRGSPFGFNATGDGSPIGGDTTFNAGQFVSSSFQDWVSATQNTNGVAGDTIQKGELLTLRFFNENILGDVDPNAPEGGDEKISPTDAVDAIAIKFDGIGTAEDLIVVLDLIDYGADGVLGGTGVNADGETTKSIYVENADFFKGNTVPSPYNTEFSLDQNDALVIIESGDYNTGSEHYQIQGMQIMQSGNGLTGQAINLNKVTDNPNTVAVEGNSPVGGPLQAWEATDNDVLKITDIGFIQSTSGQIGANLDFAVNIQDGDGDTTGIQHLLVDVVA
jgi:hypothetical protein